METVKIVLAPELGLDPAAVAAAWNAHAEAHVLGTAEVISATEADFGPRETAVGALVSIALSLTANVTYDLIKQVVADEAAQCETTLSHPLPIEIIQLEQSDGTTLLVAKYAETP